METALLRRLRRVAKRRFYIGVDINNQGCLRYNVIMKNGMQKQNIKCFIVCDDKTEQCAFDSLNEYRRAYILLNVKKIRLKNI